MEKLTIHWLVLESCWMSRSVDEIITQGTYVQKDQVTPENAKAMLVWLYLSHMTDLEFRGNRIASEHQTRR